jgi:hypothetical protein
MAQVSGAKTALKSSMCSSFTNADYAACKDTSLDTGMPASFKFYGLKNLPAHGTKPLSNKAGQLAKPTASKIVWSLVQGGTKATAIAHKRN